MPVGERAAFGAGLKFDELIGRRHNNVHVDVSARVFFVAEIEHRDAVDDADADGAEILAQWELFDRLVIVQLLYGGGHRNPAPGDSSGPRPTVRLNDVAVDVDSSFAEFVKVNDGS